MTMMRKQKSHENFKDNTFLTSTNDHETVENKANAIADDIMERVAKEMGLLSSPEITSLKKSIALPPT